MSSSKNSTNGPDILLKLQNRIKQLEAEKKELQQKNQNKLRNLRHYYESILAILPGHIYWLDKRHRYIFCNDQQAKYLNLPSRESIVGKSIYDLLPQASAEKVLQMNTQIMKTGSAYTGEESTNLHGKTEVFLSHKVPLYNRKKEITGLIGVSLNITQHKDTEEALEIALNKAESLNQAKSTFIANMSHDIRTPLSGIIGMSLLLEQGTQDLNEKQYARWIHESGQQLLSLLNGILEISALDHLDRPILHETSFSLQDCIHELIQLERPTAILKGLELQIELDPDFPRYILSDRTKIHRILLNLMSNAVKFTHQGFIKLQLTKQSETQEHVTFMLAVIDSGIGIPKSIQSKVFERFFREKPADKGLYQGHGIGLNIIQTYVQQLGGSITLQSEAGKGSTFSVTLTTQKYDPGKKISKENFQETNHVNRPHRELTEESLSRGEEDLNTALTKQETSSVAFQKRANELDDDTHPQLLLVEDNTIALKLLEHLSSLAHYPSLSATSAEEALDILKQQQIDVMITDIGLPGLSGIELTQKVRASKEQHQPIIIALTAYAPEETTRACFAAGIDAVLTKPVDFKQLELTLKNLTQSPNGQQPTLGHDLPQTEAELFELGSYPLLDSNQALQALGNKNILQEMLALMLKEQIPGDLALIQKAYELEDWGQIESLAHKMKAGALYCGTGRMRMACQYLERYRKAGHIQSLEALYQQLILVLRETMKAIQDWLTMNP